MAYYQEEHKKLAFTDWKVFIDNSSEWYDEINKKLSRAYIDTTLLKFIYPEIRSFTSSRKANLTNFNMIDIKLRKVKSVLYSSKYNDLRKSKATGEWDNKMLEVLDEVVQLLSMGLSEGELTPKPAKKNTIPYEIEGNANDLINKSLTTNNNTSIKKNGRISSNKN